MRHRAFLVAFVITVSVMTWRDISKCHDLPWPPRYMAAGVTFGLLDLFAGLISEELAGTIAVGITIAALVNKGFTPSCDHAQGTAQPQSYEVLQTTYGQLT